MFQKKYQALKLDALIYLRNYGSAMSTYHLHGKEITAQCCCCNPYCIHNKHTGEVHACVVKGFSKFPQSRREKVKSYSIVHNVLRTGCPKGAENFEKIVI